MPGRICPCALLNVCFAGASAVLNSYLIILYLKLDRSSSADRHRLYRTRSYQTGHRRPARCSYPFSPAMEVPLFPSKARIIKAVK